MPYSRVYALFMCILLAYCESQDSITFSTISQKILRKRWTYSNSLASAACKKQDAKMPMQQKQNGGDLSLGQSSNIKSPPGLPAGLPFLPGGEEEADLQAGRENKIQSRPVQTAILFFLQKQKHRGSSIALCNCALGKYLPVLK
jgi:hypothetical protein